MKALLELEQVGFVFTLEGDTMRYTHNGQRPDREYVRARLQHIQQHREDALNFLRQRTPVSIENRADALLARGDSTPRWAQEWAELAEEAGWPCWGMSWQEWVHDVTQEAEVRRAEALREEALSRWPDDPPPMAPCRPFGAGNHTTFWGRPTGGWVCATCHPPPPGIGVDEWTLTDSEWDGKQQDWS